MSGRAATEEELVDLLGAVPIEKPKSRPMGKASSELLKRSRNYPVLKGGKTHPSKFTPERLQRLVVAFADLPVAQSACVSAGIGTTLLKYWLQKSLEGKPGDGFDMISPFDGEERRFHIVWADAEQVGLGKMEVAIWHKAIGQPEPQVFQGRVVYKRDPVLVALGFGPEECYLKDEFGAPIPETVMMQDPDLMLAVMKVRDPDRWSNKQQIDIAVRGGVLVVGTTAPSSEALNLIEEEMRSGPRRAVTFDDTNSEEGE